MAIKIATILVCVDDSASGVSAGKVAAAIADRCYATVTVLGLSVPGADSSAVSAAAERVAAMVPESVAAVAIEPSCRVRDPVLYQRAAAHDLVVLGADLGCRTIPLIGQPVVTHVVSRLTRPVIVARGDTDDLSRILIGVAGGPQSLAPLRWGVQLAALLGSRADVIHVLEPMPQMYGGLARMAEGAEELIESPTVPGHVLRHSARFMRRFKVEGDILTPHGEVVEVMLRVADEGGYHLVVSGSFYARPGLAKYALGNVTRQIVLRAPCSVLIAPPHGGLLAHEAARVSGEGET